MKLRKPCIDGRYDPHWIDDPHLHPERDLWCPGGVFLPDDTLIIEKENGEWPKAVFDLFGGRAAPPVVVLDGLLDALSVREDE